jgi:hypothetical protein
VSIFLLQVQVESDQQSVSDKPLAQISSERLCLFPATTKTDDGDQYDLGCTSIPSVIVQDTNLYFEDYEEYSGPAGNDPRHISLNELSAGIDRIVAVEGPLNAKRACDIYLRGCGIKRMGPEIKNTMNNALVNSIQHQRVISENEMSEKDLLYSVVRMNGTSPIKLRTRGSRSFEEIPPSELQVVAKYLLKQHNFQSGDEEHLRAILECFGLKRLTTQVGTTLLDIMDRNFSYVDDFLKELYKSCETIS